MKIMAGLGQIRTQGNPTVVLPTMPHPAGLLFALEQRGACFFYGVKKTSGLADICSSANWEVAFAVKRK